MTLSELVQIQYALQRLGINVEIKHCKRCGEDWCYRGIGRPLRCGKCKTPYWDLDRGGSSVVEPRSSKPTVAGSSPVRRSKNFAGARESAPAMTQGSRGSVGRIESSSTATTGSSGPVVENHCGGHMVNIQRRLEGEGSSPSGSTKVCRSCESDLVCQRGKWVCLDQSCGMYGQEQK